MFMQGADGKVAGPFVTKHWRQDWRYEDASLLTYRGRLTWGYERRSRAQAAGTWTQAVYQVDDSPRYEASGRWEHFGNVSSWRSEPTWRPLPRREWSVRKDYDVLIGTNRVTITPTGWTHEEDNLKVVLDAAGRPSAGEPVLAKELGFSRYERLVGFDDCAGRRYQQRTEPFWAEVRAAWDDVARRHARFTLRAAPDQGQLFVPLFEYAEKLDEGAPFDAADARAFARDDGRRLPGARRRPVTDARHPAPVSLIMTYASTDVRQLAPADAEALIVLRREALERDPLAFGASPADDRGLDLAFVRHALASSEQAVFGRLDGGVLVGMVGVVRDTQLKRRHRAQVWGMYVAPPARRLGVGSALLAAVVRHARTWTEVEQLCLSVTDVADDARRLYERSGFRLWGREPRALRWEGQLVDELRYVLDLRTLAS